MTERVLPHNLQAEQCCLGAVLVDNEAFIAAGLSPEAFFRDAHRKLWRQMAALHAEGTPIDVVTLREALTRSGELEDVGGPGFLASLADGVPRSTNVSAYAEIVRTKARARAEIHRNTIRIDALYAGTDEDESVIEAVAKADAVLERLTSESRRFAALDAAGQFQAWRTYVERDEHGPKVWLGLPSIDNCLGGLKGGEVAGLMARPSVGKTLVLCNVLVSVIESGAAVCFSLEMPAPQITERNLRIAFGMGRNDSRRQVTQAEYCDRFAGLVLDATSGLSVPQMEARVRRLQSRGVPVRTVAIDHLGLIGGDPKLTTYDRVSKQARELKELAKRCDVAIVLLIQANRDTGGDGSRELHLGSARDSGVIEEACDYLVALRRLDKSTTLRAEDKQRFRDVIFAKVLKNRHDRELGDEIAYRIHDLSLRLTEDPAVKVDVDDLAAVAARLGGRR